MTPIPEADSFPCDSLTSSRHGFVSDGSATPRCTWKRVRGSRFCKRHQGSAGTWRDVRASKTEVKEDEA